MKHKKVSLINYPELHHCKEGDIIDYEMPSFVSGEFQATIKKDPKFGLYIDEDENHLDSCRTYEIRGHEPEPYVDPLEKTKEQFLGMISPPNLEELEEHYENCGLIPDDVRNVDRLVIGYYYLSEWFKKSSNGFDSQKQAISYAVYADLMRFIAIPLNQKNILDLVLHMLSNFDFDYYSDLLNNPNSDRYDRYRYIVDYLDLYKKNLMPFLKIIIP